MLPKTVDGLVADLTSDDPLRVEAAQKTVQQFIDRMSGVMQELIAALAPAAEAAVRIAREFESFMSQQEVRDALSERPEYADYYAGLDERREVARQRSRDDLRRKRHELHTRKSNRRRG